QDDFGAGHSAGAAHRRADGHDAFALHEPVGHVGSGHEPCGADTIAEYEDLLVVQISDPELHGFGQLHGLGVRVATIAVSGEVVGSGGVDYGAVYSQVVEALLRAREREQEQKHEGEGETLHVDRSVTSRRWTNT